MGTPLMRGVRARLPSVNPMPEQIGMHREDAAGRRCVNDSAMSRYVGAASAHIGDERADALVGIVRHAIRLSASARIRPADAPSANADTAWVDHGALRAVNPRIDTGEAIVVALLLQKNEQFAEAETLYRAIFEIAPDNPDALHYAGVLAHQQGRSEEGVALIERSLALVANRADCYSNLGIIFQAQGKLDDAIAAYQRAISLNPDHANAHSNLGVLLRATGKPAEAEAAYRTAIRLDPDHIDAYTNLGVLLTALKRTEEAVACFCKAITLRPKHRGSPKTHGAGALHDRRDRQGGEDLRGMARRGAGRPDRAPHAGGLHRPGRSAARVERIRRTNLRQSSPRASSRSSRSCRTAPRRSSRRCWKTRARKPSKSLDVLDAGCGTGLCGPLVVPYARRLSGVDLSAGMLAQAKEKNVYDALVQGELTEYLRDSSDAFDLIVSADTLVYFGAPGGRCRGRCGALRPHGLLIFTLEDAAGRDAPSAIGLELHGRYSHCRGYVERLLTGAGLASEIAHAELRMESGTPVAGLVIRATKASSTD